MADNNTKPFDKQLFEENDCNGRDVVKRFVQTIGYEAKDHPNRYGVDLDIFKGGEHVGYAEVEVRHNWNGLKFPFSDLNIPFRKKKLFEKDKPVLFFSVNEPLSALFWCPVEVILKSPTTVVKNKYVPEGEMFFKVALKDLQYVVLTRP